MARYCLFKLAIICSPDFNEFVSSWKRTHQIRDYPCWPFQLGRDTLTTPLQAQGNPPSPADLRVEGDMQLVKSSIHATLQQLRLHKLPGMHRVSSSFSSSDDNLGFCSCFRLPVVTAVLGHRNAETLLPKPNKHYTTSWAELLPAEPQMLTSKTHQRKRLIFVRGRGWKTWAEERGTVMETLEH